MFFQGCIAYQGIMECPLQIEQIHSHSLYSWDFCFWRNLRERNGGLNSSWNVFPSAFTWTSSHQIGIPPCRSNLAQMSMFVQTSRTIETEILAVLERNFVDTCCQCCQNVANIGAIFSFICIFLQNCFGSYIDIIL